MQETADSGCRWEGGLENREPEFEEGLFSPASPSILFEEFFSPCESHFLKNIVSFMMLNISISF